MIGNSTTKNYSKSYVKLFVNTKVLSSPVEAQCHSFATFRTLRTFVFCVGWYWCWILSLTQWKAQDGYQASFGVNSWVHVCASQHTFSVKSIFVCFLYFLFPIHWALLVFPMEVHNHMSADRDLVYARRLKDLLFAGKMSRYRPAVGI